MADSKFLDIAKQAATEAGKIVAAYQQKERHFTQKTHINDLVTKADVEAEQKILGIIKSTFPKHNILAEESGREDHGSEYTWAIDPIDGTLAFITGMPMYAVSVGLLKNGQPFVGAVNMVGMGQLYFAEKNKGACVNDSQIKVSAISEIEQSSLSLDFGNKNRPDRFKMRIEPFYEKIRSVYGLNGAAAELVLTARGFIDGFILSANPWDFAAGSIILEEAGGKISDYQGNPVDWSAEKINIIGSNGLIHDKMVELFNK